MGTYHALGDPTVRGNVVAGCEDREPGALEMRYVVQNPAGLRTLPATALGPVPETVKDEGAPVVSGGDPVLIWRYLVERRYLLAVFQQLVQLGANRLPIVFQRPVVREQVSRKKRMVPHQRSTTQVAVQGLKHAAAVVFYECTPLGAKGV